MQRNLRDGYMHLSNDGSPLNMTVVLMTNQLNLSGNSSSDDQNGQEDYYYDYDESINNLPLELVPVAVVYCTTLLLGVLGNSLVIFSIARYRRMQTVTNIFLTSLASADLMLVTLCVPIKVGVNIVNWSEDPYANLYVLNRESE